MRNFSVITLLLLAGCQGIPMLPGLRAHKIEIQQGNFVTQDMVAKLSPGMTRSQVRFALGTPLVVDAFHSDRWDYVYVLQKQGRTIEQRHITVVFKDEKLARIEGDVSPAKEDTTAAARLRPPIAQPQTPGASAPVPARSP